MNEHFFHAEKNARPPPSIAFITLIKREKKTNARTRGPSRTLNSEPYPQTLNPSGVVASFLGCARGGDVGKEADERDGKIFAKRFAVSVEETQVEQECFSQNLISFHSSTLLSRGEDPAGSSTLSHEKACSPPRGPSQRRVVGLFPRPTA